MSSGADADAFYFRCAQPPFEFALTMPTSSLTVPPDRLVADYVGHQGKFGHEYLEFELSSNGRLRYANSSNYKGANMIRKEGAWSSERARHATPRHATPRVRVCVAVIGSVCERQRGG